MARNKGPTLDEMGNIMEKRSSNLSSKLDEINAQINQYKDLYRTASNIDKDFYKRRLTQLIRQRKTYETHLNNHLNSQNAVETVLMNTRMAQETVMTVKSLQMASKEMKRSLRKFPQYKIERVLDQIDDLNMTANEINEIMTNSYDFDFSVEDLDAELAELDAEMLIESDFPQAPSVVQKENPIALY